MLISSKTAKAEKPLTTEEKLFKLLESIDWKLWEMYNIMKAQAEGAPSPTDAKAKTAAVPNKKSVTDK